MIGSAAALEAQDVITCQYREHGVFLQRGFELKDFMSQMTSNCNDPGKGRNMPVHYSGRNKVGVVSFWSIKYGGASRILTHISMQLHPHSVHKSHMPPGLRMH